MWWRACNGSTSRLGADARTYWRGGMPAQGLSAHACMEATMRFLDSTSFVMVLIMAGVFAPVIVIHVLATSVFQ
jgi:hypothetical protein